MEQLELCWRSDPDPDPDPGRAAAELQPEGRIRRGASAGSSSADTLHKPRSHPAAPGPGCMQESQPGLRDTGSRLAAHTKPTYDKAAQEPAEEINPLE